MLGNLMKRWFDLAFWWLPKSEPTEDRSSGSGQAKQAKPQTGPKAGGASGQAKTKSGGAQSGGGAKAKSGGTQTKSGGTKTAGTGAKAKSSGKAAGAGQSKRAGKGGKAQAAGKPADAPPSAGAELTSVKGVGATTAETLAGMGIATLQDLAAADPNEIAKTLDRPGLTPMRVRKWVDEAKQRTGAS